MDKYKKSGYFERKSPGRILKNVVVIRIVPTIFDIRVIQQKNRVS